MSLDQRLVIKGTLFLGLVVNLGCSATIATPEAKLIGKWQDASGYTREFLKDGTAYSQFPNSPVEKLGTWKVLYDDTVEVEFTQAKYEEHKRLFKTGETTERMVRSKFVVTESELILGDTKFKRVR